MGPITRIINLKKKTLALNRVAGRKGPSGRKRLQTQTENVTLTASPIFEQSNRIPSMYNIVVSSQLADELPQHHNMVQNMVRAPSLDARNAKIESNSDNARKIGQMVPAEKTVS